MYTYYYKTPDDFSNIQISSDGEMLTGLWFIGTKGVAIHNVNYVEKLLPVFEETINWLDIYFTGKEPNFMPKYKISHLTDFRTNVIKHLLMIPYGKLTTYGTIASSISKEKEMIKMSSRAVGQAVGWNPLCIIIPCHRVIGSNSSLTGYSGGLNNKIALLKLENHDIKNLFF